jgi:hypothetical protein
MKIKKEYLILSVIIVALSLYLVLHDRDRSSYQLPELSPIERNDITKIEIISAEKTIELNREGSDWKISPNAYPADASKIKDMLDVFTEFTLTALVSESKNYQVYDLDDAHKVRVKAWAKNLVVSEFDIGKAASSFRHTFVKLPENPMVYHARDNFRRKFDMNVDDLRDKIVLSFASDTIQEIVIHQGDTQSVFRKNTASPENEQSGSDEAGEKPNLPAAQTKWVNENNEIADESVLQRLLSTLADLKCDKYIEGKTKADVEPPVYTIRLKGAKEHNLSLYDALKENEDQYPASSSDNPYLFLLPKWRVDNIMKDQAEIMGKKESE